MTIDLSKIGNTQDYQHVPRTVISSGLVETPNLVLKFYSMARDEHPDEDSIFLAKSFLEQEIQESRIDPLIGLGFSILSEGMLNVARWDSKYPIVLRNDIYVFERNIRHARPTDVREAGSFCVWELGIVGHERQAWMKYLTSKRSDEDKSIYLNDAMNGQLR